MNIDGIEICCNLDVVYFGCKVEVVGVIWCKVFGVVEEGVNVCFG